MTNQEARRAAIRDQILADQASGAKRDENSIDPDVMDKLSADGWVWEAGID